MEKKPKTSKWTSREKEISCVNYENIPGIKPLSNICSSVNSSSSSKENIELSLEVEIADSLKSLITCSEKCNSDLLDVTIVRPAELGSIYPPLKTELFRASEVRSLIRSLEKEKLHKHVLAKSQSKTGELGKKQNSPKHLEARSEGQPPPLLEARKQIRSAKKHKKNEPEVHKIPFNCLTGEISEFLKNPEIGDRSYSCKECSHSSIVMVESTSTDDTRPDEYLFYKQDVTRNMGDRMQQVYAAPKTFDKLRTMLACQNKDKRDRDDEKADRPCLCQHCGMVGLLTDAQKRPIVPTSRDKILADTGWPRPQQTTRDSKPSNYREESGTPAPRRRMVDLRTNSRTRNYQNFCLINDLTDRIKVLEERMHEQEEKAVPRDYFKRVINKLLNFYNRSSPQLQRTDTDDHRKRFRNNCTQCEFGHLNDDLDEPISQPLPRGKRLRDMNTSNSFRINPVIVQTATTEADKCEKGEETFGPGKSNDKKPFSLITDFFAPQDCLETEGDENNLKENLWKWGEEIIRPGFDLKNKIVSLVEERLQNLTILKPKEKKKCEDVPIGSKKETNELPTSPKKSDKIVSANIQDKTPLVSDKKAQCKPMDSLDQNQPNDGQSNAGAIRKLLDIISEKIYHEHIKTLGRDKDNEFKPDGRGKDMDSISEEVEMYNDSLNVPSEIRRHVCGRTELENAAEARKTKKRSGIPVRIPSSSPRELMTTSKLNSTNKGDCYQKAMQVTPVNFAFTKTSPKADDKSDKYPFNRVKPSINPKSVRITYVNPRVWNAESCVSIESGIAKDDNRFHRIKDKVGEKCNKQGLKLNERKLMNAKNKNMLLDKLEFLENIANSKDKEQERLWNNIRAEAKNHGKSNQDKILIQIQPGFCDNKGHFRNKVAELEYTVEEIRNICKSVRSNSCTSLNTNEFDTETIMESRKKLEKIHEQLGLTLRKNTRTAPKWARNNKFTTL